MDFMWFYFAASSWKVNTDMSLVTCLASRKLGNIGYALWLHIFKTCDFQ
jgi:hypothetical protein